MTVCLAVFAVAPSVPAWEGKQDNKPVAELELMDDAELANEALQACKAGAITGKTYSDSGILSLRIEGARIHGEASEYQQTIALVARKTHHGTVPPWVPAMQSAYAAEDAAGCLNVWAQAYDKKYPVPAEAVKKAEQSKKGKK
jgi:hypothetical protein